MKKIVVFLMAFAFFGLIVAGTASALTLQDLFDGGSIQVNDKLFSDWILINNTLILASPDNISVTSITDPLNIGLRYDMTQPTELFSNGESSLEYVFTVTVLDPLLRIKDNSLDLSTDFLRVDSGGSVSISETVFDSFDALLGSKSVFVEDPLSGPEVSFTHADLSFPGQTALRVKTSINMYMGDPDPNSEVELGIWEQRFSQEVVPEPGTMLLLGTGLLGLVGFRRKFRS